MGISRGINVDRTYTDYDASISVFPVRLESMKI